MHSMVTTDEREVWECLERVMDPELDEPVTKMGFVESVRVEREKHQVCVDFRLPTYWCSPNFAFLMAFDMRNEIENLDWVRSVSVQLNDHCFADRINEGVNGSRKFSEVFAEYCNGEDLKSVRLKFLEKAFVRRQESILIAMEKQGFTGSEIVATTLESFDLLNFEDEETSKQKPRYRSLLLSQGLVSGDTDPAFVTWEGKRLSADGLREYLSHSRGVRLNMEFNGALCRGLKDVRYKEVDIDSSGPVPIRFIRDALSPR